MRHSTMLATAAFATLLATSAFAADLPGKGITVKPAQSTISEESFQTLLVSRALEKLGYTVEKPSEVDYNVAYTSIAAGDTTFIATNWQPLHDDMYAAAGGDNKFYRKGVYVSGAAQGYLIDKKTAEQYHITSIDQLKDPQIAKLFDTNNDGKADLTGCTPGWGCEAVINHQIDAYGLSKTVTHNQGNYAAMMADTIARYKEGKPVLYYTWTPYWVSDVLKPGKDVVWLQVPFSSLPGEQKNIDTKLANGANYGFPVNTMHIVANKAWAEKNPAAATLFSVMKLPIADINAENAMMHEGHASEADINGHVDGWIKAHQPLFDSWVKTALWAFGLTDEVFAAATARLVRDNRRWSENWMLGLAFTSWASWVCGTLAGAWSGNGLLVDYPAVEAALGFMLPALFMSFLLASFQRQQSLCVTAALAGALGGILLFSIPAAILAGIVCGCLTALLQAMLKGMPDEQ